MSMLRLAIVLSHPIQHFCPQFASWFARGLAIHVFFASTAGLRPYIDTDFGCSVQWSDLPLRVFPHTFVNGDGILPITAKLDAPALDEELEKFKPDAVLCYGYIQRLQRRALHWAHRRSCKVLFFSDSELRCPRPFYKRWLKHTWLRHYFRRIDVFLTTGDANEQYYEQYGVSSERFVRVPYPIDRPIFESAYLQRESLRGSLRERLGIRAEDFVCTMVGKLVRGKRQADLIYMLDHLPKMQQRLVLLLVGSGQDKNLLQALAGKAALHKVVFAGFVQPVELPQYYAASDLYVHCSERDPHPVAISEAVFMGLPVVVSSRCGSYGPTDDVQPGRNGFVYPVGDTRALARPVHRLATDPALYDSFSRASRDHGVRAQRLAHGEGLGAAFALLSQLSDGRLSGVCGNDSSSGRHPK